MSAHELANVEYFYKYCDEKLNTGFIGRKAYYNSKKVINIDWLCKAVREVYKEIHQPEEDCQHLLSLSYDDNTNKIVANEELVNDVIDYLSGLNFKCWTDCACYKDLNCACDCNAKGNCSNKTNCNTKTTCNCNPNCDCECGRDSECVCDCTVNSITRVCDCNCSVVPNCDYGESNAYENCECACACACNCTCNCKCSNDCSSECSSTCAPTCWNECPCLCTSTEAGNYCSTNCNCVSTCTSEPCPCSNIYS